MRKNYYFKTGIEGKNAIQAFLDYQKGVGYVAIFNVGDVERDGMFGWHIDADYFNYYKRNQARVLVRCGRRSAAKEQEAAKLLDDNALAYAQEFAAASEALGAPHMTVEAVEAAA